MELGREEIERGKGRGKKGRRKKGRRGKERRGEERTGEESRVRSSGDNRSAGRGDRS